MNLFSSKGKISINGISIEGSDISIVNGTVIVNGKELEIETKVINIQVIGDVESIDGNANTITVTGSCDRVSTMSGSVHCGNVNGDIKTMSGNVTCENVSGKIKTMSGDISHKGN